MRAQALGATGLCGVRNVTHVRNATLAVFHASLKRALAACRPSESLLVVISSVGCRVRLGFDRGSYILMADSVSCGLHECACSGRRCDVRTAVLCLA
jgi:hypothetical protein